jgi:hypothetical protein
MKSCAQCKTEFEITDEDRAFYNRVKVPEPTRCPDCRQQRRSAWRNERSLYSRTCDKCKKNIISIYSSDKPYVVYCSPCWWDDSGGGTDYAQEVDFSRPFFEQLKELQLRAPRIALYGKNNENSEYTNHTDHAKNSYMCVDVGFGENILYSQWVIRGRECADCYAVNESERSYDSQFMTSCYACVHCYSAEKSTDCFFCYDIKDVQNCFFSSALRHQQYVFMNQQLSADEYTRRMTEWDLGSYTTWQKAVDEYKKLLTDAETIHKYGQNYYTHDSTGDMLTHTKNCQKCFFMGNAEDCAHCYECIEIKDSYDAYESGFKCELQYETHACNRTSFSQFCSVCYDGSFLSYCDLCHNSSNPFGCAGMKKNEFCILNKQYTQQEYEILKAKLIHHMRATGEYGEFFPAPLSPFGYNETVAPYHYPLSDEQARIQGFNWYVGAFQGTVGKTTLSGEAIPDHIKNVSEDIAKEILECTECRRNYKIIKQELAFYKQMNLPIPRHCPDCRYRLRMSLRNPRKLWHRQCMCDRSGHNHEGRCSVEFETPYAPERPETVFCELCYTHSIN